jgi:hypothetical protein
MQESWASSIRLLLKVAMLLLSIQQQQQQQQQQQVQLQRQQQQQVPQVACLVLCHLVYVRCGAMGW